MASLDDWAARAARHILNELTQYGPGALETPQGHGEKRIVAIIATFAEPLVTQLAEQRAELTGGLSDLFKDVPARYDTPVDHYREMARRLVDDRDALKHRERLLVSLLRESKREHYECAKEGEPDDTYEECTCGADAWNARVDSALGGSPPPGDDVGLGAANGEGPGANYGQQPKRS